MSLTGVENVFVKVLGDCPIYTLFGLVVTPQEVYEPAKIVYPPVPEAVTVNPSCVNGKSLYPFSVTHVAAPYELVIPPMSNINDKKIIFFIFKSLYSHMGKSIDRL